MDLSPALALRQSNGSAYVTDGGNRILDASFGRIPDPEELAGRLSAIPGVIEHGLFLGLADIALLASPSGVEEVEV
jgi:ribose 5-phosphate isomerase A